VGLYREASRVFLIATVNIAANQFRRNDVGQSAPTHTAPGTSAPMANLVEERTRCVQWMQKALDRMNVQTHRALADITGVTGMAQLRRFFDEHIYTKAQMGPRHLRKYCALTPDCEKILENAVTKLGFSDRGYDRILKRNRTTRGRYQNLRFDYLLPANSRENATLQLLW
jgi:magnesium chelatase subunit ChlI-like protein